MVFEDLNISLLPSLYACGLGHLRWNAWYAFESSIAGNLFPSHIERHGKTIDINSKGLHCYLHLCAWGNDVVSEGFTRHVNCWLKTILNPFPRLLQGSLGEFYQRPFLLFGEVGLEKI